MSQYLARVRYWDAAREDMRLYWCWVAKGRLGALFAELLGERRVARGAQALQLLGVG